MFLFQRNCIVFAILLLGSSFRWQLLLEEVLAICPLGLLSQYRARRSSAEWSTAKHRHGHTATLSITLITRREVTDNELPGRQPLRRVDVQCPHARGRSTLPSPLSVTDDRSDPPAALRAVGLLALSYILPPFPLHLYRSSLSLALSLFIDSNLSYSCSFILAHFLREE